MQQFNVFYCNSIQKVRDAIYVPHDFKVFLISDIQQVYETEWLKEFIRDNQLEVRVYHIPYHVVVYIEEFPDIHYCPCIVMQNKLNGKENTTYFQSNGEYKNYVKNFMTKNQLSNQD